MRTTIDLINLSPSYALDRDILERVWTSKDISYQHLHVFGCRAFVHIPKDERVKLDANSNDKHREKRKTSVCLRILM